MSKIRVLAQGEKFKMIFEEASGFLTFRPEGVIDEDVNLSVVLSLLEELGSAVRGIQFDLGSVTRINSCGVREWLMLMEQLTPKITPKFVNVAEVMVDQANMITNIFGKSRNTVVSFQTPFFCARCQESRMVKLKPVSIKFDEMGEPVLPQTHCEKCSAVLQFDSIAEEFFIFLKE